MLEKLGAYKMCTSSILSAPATTAVIHGQNNVQPPRADNSSKWIVISGQSISGLIAAAIFAKAGYHVHVSDTRAEYTRNIQWAVRQALVNELASIDMKLANRFLKEVARPIYKGSTHIHNGHVRIKRHDNIRDPDPSALPANGTELINDSAVYTVEHKEFERVLKDYLSKTFQNVYFYSGKIEVIKVGANYFYVKNGGTPDLIGLAEGGHSVNRNQVGLHVRPTTEARMQIAGVICIDSGGAMIKHIREENGRRMLTGAIGHAGVAKTWIVADVDPLTCTDQNAINAEFRRLASLVLQKSIEEIDKYEIYGQVNKGHINTFYLQQTIVDKAALGDNLIVLGDAVGTGHWSVGGGAQIAAVCHAERIKTLVLDLDKATTNKAEKEAALKKYSQGVLRDTLAWLEVGARDFYPLLG